MFEIVLCVRCGFCKEYPYCILGESDKYFDEIVEKYRDEEKPLDAYKVFDLKRKKLGK